MAQWSDRQVQEYLTKYRQRGRLALDVLANKYPAVAAYESEIGKQVLGPLARRHWELLTKIAAMGATDVEKTEYVVIDKIIDRVSLQISDYYAKLAEVEKEMLPS